jgi:hypothetical protein
MESTPDTDETARRPVSRDPVDPKLRATAEMILAMPIDDRLRQLESESNFFSSIRPIDS